MNINLEKIVDIEFDGIDNKDYPDFCDAYISAAWLDLGFDQEFGFYKFRPLTDDELDWLNSEKREFVYIKLWEHLY